MDNPSHYLKEAKSLAEASCCGRYMSVKVESIHINQAVLIDSDDSPKEQKFVLFKLLISNLWKHRIHSQVNEAKMIDSVGIQHGTIYSPSHFETDITIRQGPRKKKVSGRLQPIEFYIEGQAASRGWVWFRELPVGVVPYRLIFRFQISTKGVSLAVLDEETVEIVFTTLEQGRFADERNTPLLELP